MKRSALLAALALIPACGGGGDDPPFATIEVSTSGSTVLYTLAGSGTWDVEIDWSADGGDFAVVRGTGALRRIEYPIGTVLCEAVRPTHVRLSPQRDRVAFLEHPMRGDDRGDVVVVDRKGVRTTLSSDWSSSQGLAWSPDGREVWFTASKVGADNAPASWAAAPAPSRCEGRDRSAAAKRPSRAPLPRARVRPAPPPPPSRPRPSA